MPRKPNETPEQRERRMRRWYILGISGTTFFLEKKLTSVHQDTQLGYRTKAVIAEILNNLHLLRVELKADIERLGEEK